MGIEKTRPHVCEPIYLMNMKADIEDTVKNCSHISIFRHHSPGTKQYHTKY